MSGNTIWGLMSLMGLLICSEVCVANDCTTGKHYYQQAAAAQEAAVRVPLLKKSLQICDDFSAYYLLGISLDQLGQRSEALVAFQQAAKVAGNNLARAQALASAGSVHAALGDTGKGLQMLEDAIQLAPESWMQEEAKALHRKQGAHTVAATEINQALTSVHTKSFGVVGRKPTVQLRIHFQYDRAVLDAPGQRQVQELSQALSAPRWQSSQFTLIGHTDKQGSDEYNQGLSERRAKTVARELKYQAPTLTRRLHTQGKGKKELLYLGNSEEDHQLNRRVEVRVR